MARGGFRVGAGRPRARCVAPSKGKAKRTGESETGAVKSSPDMSPLDYMLAVMRDETVDEVRRDRMAVAAAQYLHEKADSKKIGKKERREEAAKQSSNVFSLNRAKLKLAVENN